jgi:hypothetical protein
VAIMSFHLVRDGVFQESGISELLVAAGTRNLSDNLSDLKAQVAANQQGMFWVCQELQIAAGVSITVIRDEYNTYLKHRTGFVCELANSAAGVSALV